MTQFVAQPVEERLKPARLLAELSMMVQFTTEPPMLP
jgi:hypothetical protein